ncbi:MAG: acyl-CoA thioesterase [Gammaproteobacteria bacterium]
MTETKDTRGRLAIRIVAMPKDTNANGDIFGGWLVSHMDMGGGIEARRRARCRVVTVAIDAMQFIKPVTVGDTVCCYANLLKVGRTSMQFKIEAWTLALEDEEPKKVAEGIFTFVAIDESGKPHPVDR